MYDNFVNNNIVNTNKLSLRQFIEFVLQPYLSIKENQEKDQTYFGFNPR